MNRIIAGKNRIIFPLDTSDLDEALELVKELKSEVGLFKIGLELIYTMIKSIIICDRATAISNMDKIRSLFEELGDKCMVDDSEYFRIFLDGKLDDIPNTVGEASGNIADMKVQFFNVHASAGIEAIRAAAGKKGNSKLLVVTILTSIGIKECESIFGKIPGYKVEQLTRMAKEAGADGIICSAKELELLAKIEEFDDLIKVTPGIRLGGTPLNDQSEDRVMTPGEAIEAGADFIVVGRSIKNASAEMGGRKGAARMVAQEVIEAESRMLKMNS